MAKITVGEVLVGGTTALSILPNQDNWVFALPVGLAALALYGFRRSHTFRQVVDGWLDQLDTAEFPGADAAFAVTRRLPVPPFGANGQLMLPAPKAPAPPKTTLTATARPAAGEWKNNVFGGDDPLERVRRRALAQKILAERRARGDTRPIKLKEGSVTRQLRPVADDDSWVNAGKQPVAEVAAPPKVMSLKELCSTVNDDPDTYPFVAIFGPPRAGKTTLAQLIAMVRPGRVIILDPKRPKGYEPPKWGGLPYVTKDLQGTYKPMIEALTAVCGPGKEMERRYQQQEHAKAPYEQLTIIIDEAKDVVEQCPEIAALYRRIITIGAEARVRLILLSTTDRARKLGFEGEADSLEGFVTIRLGSFARKVLPTCGGTSENPKHWAAVNLGEWTAVDTVRTKELLDKAAPGRVWQGVSYNCQVASTKVGTSTPVQRPISANTSTGEEDFLAAMFAKYGSRLTPGEVSKETRSETRAESLGNSAGGNGTGKSQKALSDATSEDFRLVLQSAKDTLKTVSAEEGRKLGNSVKLFTQGVGKQEAIMQGFGLTSAGRGYSRGKELFDALRLLQEHGLVVR